MPGVGHRESWDDTGSGESSGECDDEDGCEGSGDYVVSTRELTTKAHLHQGFHGWFVLVQCWSI